MDSTALGTLVGAVNRSKRMAARSKWSGPSDRIAGLFHVMELDTVVLLCA
jgi:anti-anti-sigma regulatory factor